MTNSTFISTTDLKSRRNKLKKERAWRELQGFLRGFCLISLTGASFWLITLPDWVIRNKQQIKVQGNDLLSVEEVRNLIPLNYPQSLIQLSTHDLTRQLQQKIPLTEVVVTREFIPPSLSVTITEKPPVAIAYGRDFSGKKPSLKIVKLGYLDEDGVFISHEMYHKLKENPDQAPKLKIIGIPKMYLPYWQEFYNLLIQSEIYITEVNWQNPTNIILTTDLGKIHIGAYSSRFPKQLITLAKLKPLTGKIRREQIVYIDLTDPEMPLIKQKQIVTNNKPAELKN